MTFSPDLADLRFGCGLSPLVAAPQSVAEMMARLRGPDAMAAAHPIATFATADPDMVSFRELFLAKNDGAAALEAFQAAQARMRDSVVLDLRSTLARGVETQDGLRERLTRFWADHFSILARNGLTRHQVTPYVEEAIRPYLTGRFADMLFAAVTHPMMVMYLDQANSTGPNSPRAHNGQRGLNENLARELLELHTLGVDGPYSQDDVRQLAELLTGLTWTYADGRFYRPRQAEPGAETVLGVTYPEAASLDTIRAALDDLAVHPVTARHIAGKLAAHFMADEPDAGLVDAMTAVFRQTDGDLGAVVAAMLDHPAAWAVDVAAKVKTPFGFIQSALRALAVPMAALAPDVVQATTRRPLRDLGQEWERPPGPDGWPDRATDWITPQGMAGRITWSLRMPRRLADPLPDPRRFVVDALGTAAPREVVFAAGAAEDRATGVGVVLASAAFQRRG